MSREPEALDLFIFECQLARELERADRKHGTWGDLTPEQMTDKITDELDEVCKAEKRNDVDGEHGMKAELVQVAVTAFKMWRRL